MANGKKSFVLYCDLIHTVKKMPKEKDGGLFMTILSYVNDKNPETDDLLLKVAFEPIKLHIDKQRYNHKDKHWNWKGGITPINRIIRNGRDNKIWRKSVFERDNYTCQHCFVVGGKLHAHHKKEFSKYPKQRFKINNGVTLCKPCHILIHKKNG